MCSIAWGLSCCACWASADTARSPAATGRQLRNIRGMECCRKFARTFSRPTNVSREPMQNGGGSLVRPADSRPYYCTFCAAEPLPQKTHRGVAAPAYLPIPSRGSRTKPSRFGIFTCGRVLASITSASIKSFTPLLWADLEAHGPSPAQTNERVFGRGVSALTRSSASGQRSPFWLREPDSVFALQQTTHPQTARLCKPGPQTDIPKPA